MTGAAHPGEIVKALRSKAEAEGGLFWIEEGQLAVMDCDASAEVERANFADLTLRDTWWDMLRHRKSATVSWQEVREAMIAGQTGTVGREALRSLSRRMAAALDALDGEEVDIAAICQRITSATLVPFVITDPRPGEERAILRDQSAKLAFVTGTRPPQPSLLGALRQAWPQIRCGQAVRAVLKRRWRGGAPRRDDIADSVIDLLPRLGLDRAVEAITGVLTAIAGPPGSVAACLLLELARQPDWARRLAEEQQGVSDDDFFAAPAKAAPLSLRFVKEVMRLWPPPSITSRPARCPIHLRGETLEPGESYVVSAYVCHRDPAQWSDPDRFDPDRWLRSAEGVSKNRYIPFGWAPRTCIGAQLGLMQLLIWVRLAAGLYRLVPSAQAEPFVLTLGLPLVQDFRGIFRRAE